MKIKMTLFVLIILVGTMLSGCSYGTKTNEKTDTTRSKTETTSPKLSTSVSNKEQTKVLSIKKSKDNKDYSRDGKVNIPVNGKYETLYITREDIKTSDANNKPTKITLKIKNSQIVFESLWNDGVYVSIADFDNADKDMDIYITELGTDIGCTTHIYKFDGTKIYKYDKIQHFGGDFLYDEKGNIYYWLNDGSKKEINKCYNYRTKQSGNITDENLKIRLNEF